MTKPISPDEVDDEKLKNIPDEVIETINGFIAQDWDGRMAKISNSTLTRVLKDKLGSRFRHDWLKFETIYRQAGWKVVCDRPGYNECYDMNWTFTKEK